MGMWELSNHYYWLCFLDRPDMPTSQEDGCGDGDDWLSSNSVYIDRKDRVILIPGETAIIDDLMSTLLEGAVSMINCLYEQDKAFLLILTMDSDERKYTSLIPVVYEFLDVFLEDVIYWPS